MIKLKMNIRRYTVLAVIIILAFILRFWRLGSFPALNADEAALGYNAWSLITTGMDEHGNMWPIHLQSFNDFKPAFYAYIILPFIYIGGLSTWMIRIPGAFLGVMSVVVTFFIAREVADKPKLSVFRFNFSTAEIAALFLAISPWHIHFSRGGWEVNVATFFIALGVLFFYRLIRNPTSLRFLIVVLSFAISLYTYHAARVIVPMLGVGFVVVYWKELFKSWRKLLLGSLVGIIIMVPLFVDLVGPAGLSRAAGVGIFSDPGPLNEINEQRGEHFDLNSLDTKIVHNKPLNYTLAVAENWGEHFTGEFLFLSGDDIQRNKVPEHGQMYLVDALLVVFGLVSISKVLNKRWGIILWWLIVAPVAAALTFQSPHALRSQNMVIPLVIISAFGLANVIGFINNINYKFIRTVFYLLIVTVIVWSFTRYQQLYWVHMPRAYSYSSQYGFEEMAEYVDSVYENFDHIIITDRYDQPYILNLFYTKYPPKDFQFVHELSARDGYGFSTVRGYDKYEFVSIGDFGSIISNNSNTLIVGTPNEIPDASNIVKVIYFPNGDEAFRIVAN